MGGERGKHAEAQNPLGTSFTQESYNILVASPKSEQGFPPVNRQRCKQLTKALAPATAWQLLFPLQMGELREQLLVTTVTFSVQTDTFIFHLLCPTQPSPGGVDPHGCPLTQGSSLLEVMAPTNCGSIQRCSLTYSHTGERKCQG